MTTATFGPLVIGAYLAGSVPFGLLVGLARGVDVRKSGSGNIGATNVARVLGGKKWFFLVFVLDLLKGLLPVLAATILLRGQPASAGGYLQLLAVAAAAVLGHLYSVFLGFKGGKGVATSTGVLLGVWPYFTIPLLLAVTVFVVVFYLWRYISLASIAAAASVPLFYVLLAMVPRLRFSSTPWPVTGEQWPLLAFLVLMSALIIFKHRANIARLTAGTEPKFQKKQS